MPACAADPAHGAARSASLSSGAETPAHAPGHAGRAETAGLTTMNPLMAPDSAHHGARCALSVNVNKVALLRNTRHLGIPSVVRAAEACLLAGAPMYSALI
eukprot:Opistho-2@81784